MNEIKNNITNFLKTAKIPQGVENIRVACKIGNWNTALKHCLELLIQETISGQRTSKGWIFWVENNE